MLGSRWLRAVGESARSGHGSKDSWFFHGLDQRYTRLLELVPHPETDPAVMAEVDGTVHYGEIVKGSRKIIVRTDDGEEREERNQLDEEIR